MKMMYYASQVLDIPLKICCSIKCESKCKFAITSRFFEYFPMGTFTYIKTALESRRTGGVTPTQTGWKWSFPGPADWI